MLQTQKPLPEHLQKMSADITAALAEHRRPKRENTDKPKDTTESDEKSLSEAAQDRAGVNKPGYKELSAHMDRFGPEGVVESALHLPDEQKEKLEKRAKNMRYSKEKKKWVHK